MPRALLPLLIVPAMAVAGAPSPPAPPLPESRAAAMARRLEARARTIARRDVQKAGVLADRLARRAWELGFLQEVVPEGQRVLEAAGAKFGVEYEWAEFSWDCSTYESKGWIMPPDGIEQLRPYDAVFLGAVGWPGVPDHISLWDMLIPIRREFDQYVNLRPVRLLEGMETPLKGREPGDIDFFVVRENVEANQRLRLSVTGD